MKRILLFSAAVLVAASTFTSCKKQYYCNCTNGTDKEYYDLGSQKKKDADAACTASSSLYTIVGGSCSLSTTSEGTQI